MNEEVNFISKSNGKFFGQKPTGNDNIGKKILKPISDTSLCKSDFHSNYFPHFIFIKKNKTFYALQLFFLSYFTSPLLSQKKSHRFSFKYMCSLLQQSYQQLTKASILGCFISQWLAICRYSFIEKGNI